MKRVLGYLLVTFAVWAYASGMAFAQERVLRVNDAAIGELDPHKGTDYADSILMFNVYDFLVRAAAGGEIVPDLATSWTASDDGLTYTFKLRGDAKFHDGSPVEANDVVFSANRMTAMKRGFSYLLADFSVKALDNRTVEFKLTEPFVPFIASLVRVAVVNKDLVMANIKKPGDFGEFGDYGDVYLSANEVGSGSYIIESHNPQELSVLRRNEEHYAGFSSKPPDVVRLVYALEPSTIRVMMPRGEHDLTRMSLPVEILQALARDPEISLVQDLGGSQFYIKLNTKRAPTDDVHFRRAMALAFDYEMVLRLLDVGDGMRTGVAAHGPLPRGLMGFDDSALAPKRDLEAARAELAKSKYAAGDHTIDIQWVAEVPTYGDVALIFQQSMADVGIKVNVVKSPWALLLEKATSAETTPHANTVSVRANTPDPDSLLSSMYHSSNVGSWTSMEWLQDSEVDRLLEEGRTITDVAAREDFYKNLVRKIADMQPAIFAYENLTVVAKRNNVRAPQLEDAKNAIVSMGMNYLFRNYEILN